MLASALTFANVCCLGGNRHLLRSAKDKHCVICLLLSLVQMFVALGATDIFSPRHSASPLGLALCARLAKMFVA